MRRGEMSAFWPRGGSQSVKPPWTEAISGFNRTLSLGRIALLPLCLLLALPAAAQPALDPSGIWQTETGISRVRIAPCGNGFCGTLAAVGGAGLDSKNPDPALRQRKLVGVRILDAGQRTATGYEGSLYNPSDGKTYSGTLTPKTVDTLIVSGCVLGVFCKSQTWRRAK